MSDYVAIKDLPIFADERGELVVFDSMSIPFEIKRVFWMDVTIGQVRGGHRHIKTDQYLVCLKGTVEVYLDDGQRKLNVTLDSINKCLLVKHTDWHTMRFIEDSILIVLASHSYEPEDYIYESY